MMPARLRLDFERSSAFPGWLGLVILAGGIFGTVAAYADYRSVLAEIAALELRHDTLLPASGPVSPSVVQGVAEARSAVRELAIPWSPLLLEIEQAGKQSKGNVALLAIEPDPVHGRVRILAEARSLPAALLYVYRLQHGNALRDALLDKHEVQIKDPERPVRFELTANWATSS